MNDRQYALYQTLKRVLAFTREHAPEFANESPGAKAIAAITGLEAKLKPLTVNRQGIAPSSGTEVKEDLLTALRDDLKDIARTARAIEEGQPPEPGFALSYALPADRSQRSLIAHARSLLTLLSATPSPAPRFIAYELPADFVEDLRLDLATIDKASATQADDRIGGVEDTATTLLLIQQARAALTQLSASVLNKYRRRPELLAAWRTASRVDQPGTNTAPAPPEAPATA